MVSNLYLISLKLDSKKSVIPTSWDKTPSMCDYIDWSNEFSRICFYEQMIFLISSESFLLLVMHYFCMSMTVSTIIFTFFCSSFFIMLLSHNILEMHAWIWRKHPGKRTSISASLNIPPFFRFKKEPISKSWVFR